MFHDCNVIKLVPAFHFSIKKRKLGPNEYHVSHHHIQICLDLIGFYMELPLLNLDYILIWFTGRISMENQWLLMRMTKLILLCLSCSLQPNPSRWFPSDEWGVGVSVLSCGFVLQLIYCPFNGFFWNQNSKLYRMEHGWIVYRAVGWWCWFFKLVLVANQTLWQHVDLRHGNLLPMALWFWPREELLIMYISKGNLLPISSNNVFQEEVKIPGGIVLSHDWVCARTRKWTWATNLELNENILYTMFRIPWYINIQEQLCNNHSRRLGVLHRFVIVPSKET